MWRPDTHYGIIPAKFPQQIFWFEVTGPAYTERIRTKAYDTGLKLVGYIIGKSDTNWQIIVDVDRRQIPLRVFIESTHHTSPYVTWPILKATPPETNDAIRMQLSLT